MNQHNIIVSIFMLTYNQESFIAQAIEGVLMQKTSFNYQLVIGEDCSTDNTRNICEEYASKYGDKIKLLSLLEVNIGLIKNYIRTIKECDGKYIAICDGDDYWIDDKKLQKQVDFLEHNNDFAIIFSPILKLFSNGEMQKSYHDNVRKTLNFKDLVDTNFIPSVSSLFRNIQGSETLPKWIDKFPYGDWPTYLWTIKDQGKIYCMEDITSVYRFNIGESSKITDFDKIDVLILESMYNDEIFKKNKPLILNSISEKYINIMLVNNSSKNFFLAFKTLLNLLLFRPKKVKALRLYLYSLKLRLKNN